MEQAYLLQQNFKRTSKHFQNKIPPKLPSSVPPKDRRKVEEINKQYKNVIEEMGENGPQKLKMTNFEKQEAQGPYPHQPEPEKMNFAERLKMFNAPQQPNQ